MGWDNLPRRLGVVYCTNRRSLLSNMMQLLMISYVLLYRSALYHTSLENGICGMEN